MSLTQQQTIGLSILGAALYASFSFNNRSINPSINNRNVDGDNAPDANLIIISSENDSKNAIANINAVRKKSGLPPLNYSTKAYKLATARAKDMNQYNYFDFTNPQTKSCTDKMKQAFGFKPDEFLAESNIRYVPVGANIGAPPKNVSEVAKEWVEQNSGSDPNFLFRLHVAGAVGCDGNKCVFLALNYSDYGKGCGLKK